MKRKPLHRVIRLSTATVVLAVAALIGVAASPASALDFGHSRHRLVVGIGDSFTSGEGNPPFVDNSGVTGCNRSNVAYPIKTARFVRATGKNVACSGAKTDDIFNPYKGERPQVDFIKKADEVVLTIGGNDIGALGAVTNFPTPQELQVRLSQLGIKLATDTYPKLKLAAPKARITVVGYPRLFSSSPSEINGCPLNASQRAALNAAADALDATIKQAATTANLNYISTISTFDGHELCTPPQGSGTPTPGSTPSVDSQPWLNATLHPTATGHREIASLVAESIGRCGGRQRTA